MGSIQTRVSQRQTTDDIVRVLKEQMAVGKTIGQG